jgi:hypothetical protein
LLPRLRRHIEEQENVAKQHRIAGAISAEQQVDPALRVGSAICQAGPSSAGDTPQVTGFSAGVRTVRCQRCCGVSSANRRALISDTVASVSPGNRGMSACRHCARDAPHVQAAVDLLIEIRQMLDGGNGADPPCCLRRQSTQRFATAAMSQVLNRAGPSGRKLRSLRKPSSHSARQT